MDTLEILFPHVSRDEIEDVLKACSGDINDAANALTQLPQTPQSRHTARCADVPSAASSVLADRPSASHEDHLNALAAQLSSVEIASGDARLELQLVDCADLTSSRADGTEQPCIGRYRKNFASVGIRCSVEIASPALQRLIGNAGIDFTRNGGGSGEFEFCLVFSGDACFEAATKVVHFGEGTRTGTSGTATEILLLSRRRTSGSRQSGAYGAANVIPSVIKVQLAVRAIISPEAASCLLGESNIKDMFERPVLSTDLHLSLDEFAGHFFDTDKDDYPLNCLLFGPPGCGKSSLANTLYSCLSDHVHGDIAQAGSSRDHVTTRFTGYQICGERRGQWQRTRLNLFDTWGLGRQFQSGEGANWNYTSDMFASMLKGSMRHNFSMAETNPCAPRPNWERVINCVIFCVPIDCIDVTGDDVVEMLKPYCRAAREQGRPCVLAVTQVDRALGKTFPSADPQSESWDEQSMALNPKLSLAASQLGFDNADTFATVAYGQTHTRKHIGIDRLIFKLFDRVLNLAKEADQEYF